MSEELANAAYKDSDTILNLKAQFEPMVIKTMSKFNSDDGYVWDFLDLKSLYWISI